MRPAVWMVQRPTDLPEMRPDAASATPRRVAVLLRSHLKGSAKAMELAAQLSAVPEWDVFFAVDETGGAIDVGPYRKVAHSVAACTALGLFTDRPRAMSYFGDYPFYATFGQIPEYDFYLMVEYDVGLADKEGDYFHRLAARLRAPDLADLDLLATNHRPKTPGRDKRPHRFAHPWKSIFPVVGLSRAGIIHLYRERLREAELTPLSDGQRHVYCEYFASSAMEAAGRFRCLPLNAVLPGSIDKVSFNTRDGRLLGREDALPATAALLHPVLDFPQFVGKMTGIAIKWGRAEAFRRELDTFRQAGYSGPALEAAEARLLLVRRRADAVAGRRAREEARRTA